jgi:GNAT superfamily N-acetyltransferase
MKDGIPVGMMTGVAGPHSFSRRIRTSSDLLFVLPEHRGGMAAVKLMKRYKEWSMGLGAAYSYISVSTGVTPEKTTKFYEFMGFRPMEKMYRRDYVYRD